MSDLTKRLRNIGTTQAGALKTESGILWHPANEMLEAASRIEELEGALREWLNFVSPESGWGTWPRMEGSELFWAPVFRGKSRGLGYRWATRLPIPP